LTAAAAGLNWVLVERIARRHRVEALVWAAMRRVGLDASPGPTQALKAAADRLARQNLRIAAACSALRETFDRAGIPILFVKGISLAQLAYGNILLKSGWDIDILVPGDCANSAADQLRTIGYEPVIPAGFADTGAVGAWHRLFKESVWRHPVRGTHVELHTALTDHPMLLRGVGSDSPTQDVRISGHFALPTLATDELFAYLCVHGGSSAWFRLKWIADLAALLTPYDATELDRLYARSQELGAARSADVALILCHDLFQTRVSPALVEALRSRPGNRRLLAAVQRSLVGRAVATELSDLRFGTWAVHLFQAGVMPGLRYKLTALWVELQSKARHHPRFRARR
jgi:hypothetical protein